MEVITITHKHTHCYLLRNSSKWVMLDALWPNSFSMLTAALQEYKILFTDIACLFITHFHMDHAGLAQVLKDHDVKLYLHECQCGYADNMNRFFIRKPDKTYRPIIEEDCTIVTSEQSRLLLQKFCVRGVLLSTPGHTMDSISLAIDECCAFTGDLPHLDIIDGSSLWAHYSWEQLRCHQVKEIYPAHGDKYQVAFDTRVFQV